MPIPKNKKNILDSLKIKSSQATDIASAGVSAFTIGLVGTLVVIIIFMIFLAIFMKGVVSGWF